MNDIRAQTVTKYLGFPTGTRFVLRNTHTHTHKLFSLFRESVVTRHFYTY